VNAIQAALVTDCKAQQGTQLSAELAPCILETILHAIVRALAVIIIRSAILQLVECNGDAS